MTEKEWLDTFGENLMGMLNEARMTQRDLAEVSGISRPSISRYLSGQMAPSFKAIINIAYALDCDVCDLIDFGSIIE